MKDSPVAAIELHRNKARDVTVQKQQFQKTQCRYALSSSQKDVPSVNLVKPLKTQTIHNELSWWTKCCRHHPHPMSASKAVYCLEVHTSWQQTYPLSTQMAVILNKKERYCRRPMYMPSHSLRHQAHLPLHWGESLTREKLHAKFRSFQGTPSMTTYLPNQCSQVLKRYEL